MASEVINGAFTPDKATEARHVVSPGVMLTVEPEGLTAAFMRNGIKWPGGRKVTAFVGEIDGVRSYVHQGDDGRIHIVMTRRDIKV